MVSVVAMLPFVGCGQPFSVDHPEQPHELLEGFADNPEPRCVSVDCSPRDRTHCADAKLTIVAERGKRVPDAELEGRQHWTPLQRWRHAANLERYFLKPRDRMPELALP
jgi:hypothetical protein